MFRKQGNDWFPVEETRTENGVQYRVKRYWPGGGNLREDPVTNRMEIEDLLLVLE